MYKVKVKGQRLTEPLTSEEKKEIRKRALAGEKQVSIALAFHVHPYTVARVCAAAGIRRWAQLTTALEAKAVHLLREGKGLHRVAKAMRLPDRIIGELMTKHKIVHKIGGGPKLPARKMARIVEAVQNHEDHMYLLAKKIGVDRSTIRKIAYQVLGVDRFIGFPNIRPLTALSNSEARAEAACRKFLETIFREKFSMEAQAMELTGIFVRLILDFTTIWYDGQIPTDRVSFISEVLEAYMPANRPEFVRMLTDAEWRRERELAAGYIRAAMDHIAGPESRWTN